MAFKRRLLVLALLALICCQAGSAFSQTGLVDFIIDNPTTAEPLYPWGQGRMASLGGLSGFLYRTESFNDWLYLLDTAGNESHIPLPDQYRKNERANAEYVFTTPEHLWVWSGVFGAAKLRHYQLEAAAPLPTRATLLSATTIGNSSSRPAGLLRLANGGFVGVWYQFEYHADRHLEIGIIYGRPDGTIQSLSPIRVAGDEGNIVGSRFALAQHPADGSIWVFFKRDSYHQISAIHLSETETAIKVDWIRADFISERDGKHAPESEYPSLQAAPDLQRKTLRLAYQNRNYQMFYVADKAGRYVSGRCAAETGKKLDPAFFSKGAYISIAEIKQDHSRSFLLFPTYAEATRSFGFTVAGELWLAFQAVDCTMKTYDSLQRRGKLYLSHYAGSWSQPILLGQWHADKEYYAAPILFNHNRPEFVMRLKDNKLHIFEGF